MWYLLILVRPLQDVVKPSILYCTAWFVLYFLWYCMVWWSSYLLYLLQCMCSMVCPERCAVCVSGVCVRQLVSYMALCQLHFVLWWCIFYVLCSKECVVWCVLCGLACVLWRMLRWTLYCVICLVQDLSCWVVFCLVLHVGYGMCCISWCVFQVWDVWCCALVVFHLVPVV